MTLTSFKSSSPRTKSSFGRHTNMAESPPARTLTRPRQFKSCCNENCQLHIAIYVLVNRGDIGNDVNKSERWDCAILSNNEKRSISIASIDQRGEILHERFILLDGWNSDLSSIINKRANRDTSDRSIARAFRNTLWSYYKFLSKK